MTSVLVWLLVIANPTYGGMNSQVQVPYFVNASDCEQVGNASKRLSRSSDFQCVQAFVFVERTKSVTQSGGGK